MTYNYFKFDGDKCLSMIDPITGNEMPCRTLFYQGALHYDEAYSIHLDNYGELFLFIRDILGNYGNGSPTPFYDVVRHIAKKNRLNETGFAKFSICGCRLSADALPNYVKALDIILTERFGGRKIDMPHRLAGHVQLEFD